VEAKGQESESRLALGVSINRACNSGSRRRSDNAERLDANYRHDPGRNQTVQPGTYVNACPGQS
jgi:hypothetical protein